MISPDWYKPFAISHSRITVYPLSNYGENDWKDQSMDRIMTQLPDKKHGYKSLTSYDKKLISSDAESSY